MPNRPLPVPNVADVDARRGGRSGRADGAVPHELPKQPVESNERRRSPIPAAVATGLVLLILVGAGFLGSIDRPKPSQTDVVVGNATHASVQPRDPWTPEITPALTCGSATAEAGVVLSVDGRTVAPSIEDIELIDSSVGVTPPAELDAPNAFGRVDIPRNVITELTAVGRACANAWRITLTDPGRTTLDVAMGGDRRAPQYRFPLVLASFRGGEFDLAAALVFPDAVVRVSWRIRILPFDGPHVTVTVDKHVVDLVPDCDGTLAFASGWTEKLTPCSPNLSVLPHVSVAPAERIVFGVGGWHLHETHVMCGVLVNGQFERRDRADCVGEPVGPGVPAVFRAPHSSGRWEAAIFLCADWEQRASVCGTWYATLRVQ